jgi:hypothetical protein
MTEPLTPYTFKVSLDDGNYTDVDYILQEHLRTNRESVFEWFKKELPEIDLLEYEGGIDDWWGMGSVTMWELGLEFTFKYSCDGLVVTIG